MERRKPPLEELHPGTGWLAADRLHRADLAEYYRRVFDRMEPYILERRVTSGPLRYVTPITPKMLIEGALHGNVEILCGACPYPWQGLPDRLAFEIDAADAGDPRGAREGALLLGELVERLGLEPFVKTSGDRGYHVWVPILPREPVATVLELEMQMILYLVSNVPGLLDGSLGSSGVWIVPARSDRSMATVAPYSARSLEGYPVSLPLDWAELRRQVIDPKRYSIKNVFLRLAQKLDPWRGWSDARRSLEEARRELSTLMGRPARVD